MRPCVPALRPGQPGQFAVAEMIAFRAAQAIESHLAEPDLTPSRVAKLTGISLRYLQSIFASFGETPTRYIRARRLQHCCEDLSDPRFFGHSIAEISYRWGFSDSGYFSRVFKQNHGQAPSRYRAAERREAEGVQDRG